VNIADFEDSSFKNSVDSGCFGNVENYENFQAFDRFDNTGCFKIFENLANSPTFETLVCDVEGPGLMILRAGAIIAEGKWKP